MKFLRSRYLLFLFLVIAAIEVAVRMGAYEPFASPDSPAGITIKLKGAVHAFGEKNVNVVTFGDSDASDRGRPQYWGQSIFIASLKPMEESRKLAKNVNIQPRNHCGPNETNC